MNTILKRVLLSACVPTLFALFSKSAAAGVELFYAGDPNGATATYNMDLVSPYPPPYFYENTFRVFDNFNVPTGQTWSINDIFAVISNPGGAFANASYEIRTGMTNGTGGTLIASGTLPALITPLSGVPTINGLPSERLDVDLPTPLTLPGGTMYWVSLVPVAYDSYNRFIGSGTAHAVNAPATSEAYYFSQQTGYTYGNNPGTYTTFQPYSLGVAGSDVVSSPEPSTIVGAGIAGLMALGYGWRRRKGAGSRSTNA